MSAPHAAPAGHDEPEQSGFAVQTTGLTVDCGDTRALDGIDLTLPAGAITGLLGRNGSGKTTLLTTLAAHRRPSAGHVQVDGENPWENQRLMEGTCLIQEAGHLMKDEKLSQNLDVVASLRPQWSEELAGRLMDAYELQPRKTLDSLSRGQRSAFAVVVVLERGRPVITGEADELRAHHPGGLQELVVEIARQRGARRPGAPETEGSA